MRQFQQQQQQQQEQQPAPLRNAANLFKAAAGEFAARCAPEQTLNQRLQQAPRSFSQKMGTVATLSVTSLGSRNNSIFSAFGGKLNQPAGRPLFLSLD